MLSKLSKIIVFSFLFLFFVRSIGAHGTAVSVSKDVADFTTEFEYGEPVVVEGETTSYVFRLLDQKTKSAVKFDSVLVRIEQKSDQSTAIVARLAPDELQDGVSRLTTTLNKGEYLVTAAFYKDDKKIVESSYDLSVQKESGNSFPTIPVVSGGVGIVVGFIVSKLGKKTKDS